MGAKSISANTGEVIQIQLAFRKTPWCNIDMDESRIKHEGKWSARLSPDRGNAREEVFATRWEEENRTRRGILVCLLHSRFNERGSQEVDEDDLTQEEASNAATVIQWLGSPVGWSFLEKCIRECGYRLEGTNE